MSEEQNAMAATGTNVGDQGQPQKKRTSSKKITPPEQAPEVGQAPEVEQADEQALNFPCEMIIHNHTYAAVAFPEVLNERVKGGESVIVTVKNQAVLDSINRNAQAINSIGHWQAPNGVFIELAENKEGD